LRVKALMDQEVRDKVKVEPGEVKAFYDGHPEYFQQPAQIRASHILVLVPQDADDKVKGEKKTAIDKARERVEKGEDFAKVAGELSEDPGSKNNGGDLDFFGQGQMVKPFEEAAFALKSNEVSQVVTTQFGYHIIKRTGSRPATTLPLATEKDKIEEHLKQQKVRDGLQAYVDGLRKDAQVEILLEP
jgi:peptidyl-prolyl cis-trans isomerase C